MAMSPEQRKANRRLGLILATVTVVFMVGFVIRMALFGG
jgi:hypothetical protein